MPHLYEFRQAVKEVVGVATVWIKHVRIEEDCKQMIAASPLSVLLGLSHLVSSHLL